MNWEKIPCRHCGMTFENLHDRDEHERCHVPSTALREAKANMGHHCHAVDCNESVPPKMHMCLRHWRMVPKAVQGLIWEHYRAGQENDKRPSVEYLATAFVSVSCVALKEGKALPTLTTGDAP